jgi:hypothetical protein
MSAPLPDLPAPAGAIIAPRARPRAGGRLRALRIWLPAGFLILLAAACFAWPQVYPVPRPVGGSILNAGLPPLSPGHILGTDPVGNDVLSRILYGGQISFEVGFAVTAIGLAAGGRLEECASIPRPARRPPIIIGGAGRRRTPALAARFADEFNAGMAPGTAERFQSFRRFCEQAGRDPAQVRLSTTLPVCCGRTRLELPPPPPAATNQAR